MAGKFPRIICTLIISFLFLSLISPQTQQVMSQTTRKGGWVDTITYDEVPYEEVLTSLNEGSLDIYASSLTPEDMLAVSNDPSLSLKANISNGLYYELTFNPSVFSDTGKLNPFSVPRIREAMNYLVDREYLNNTFFSSLALERYFPIPTNSFDYLQLSTKVNELESKYAYNFATAATMITEEMGKLTAYKQEGTWYYEGNPVEIIFIIRNDSDGKRVFIGDYVADQLESLGFMVTRQYMSAAEASPIWLMSEPSEGQWHIYTGAWNTSGIVRDASSYFIFFYTKDSLYGDIYQHPLYLAYTPSEDFYSLATDLWLHNFDTEEAYYLAYEQALDLALQDSARIFLLDGQFFFPHRANLVAAYNTQSGLVNALWPLTTRYIETEGGLVRAGVESFYEGAYHPYSGADFTLLATSDFDILEHPTLGSPLPQRIDHAEVVIPTNEHYRNSVGDWLSVSFSDNIFIPDDAFVGWDAIDQRFLTALETDPEATNRLVMSKSIVTYQSDLFEVSKWHDGSSLDLADFIMNIIMEYERLDPNSAMYDEEYASLGHNIQNIRGFKILSQSPLVIETYMAGFNWELDMNPTSWWPGKLDYGGMATPWHLTALTVLAETNQQLALGTVKAEALQVPQTDYIRGDSLGILGGIRQTISYQNLPYLNTLNQYITEEEFNARYANLATWYTEYGHYWVSNGPYYLESFDETASPQIVLRHFDEFPDEAGKWDQFTQGSLEELIINYSYDGPGSTITLIGQYFPANSDATVYLNRIPVGELTTDSEGCFNATFSMPEELPEGQYIVTVSVNPTFSVLLTVDTGIPIREHDQLPIHIDVSSDLIPDITQFIDAPVDPISIGSNIEVSLPFAEIGSETYDAIWDWGDGSSSTGEVNESGIAGSHVYSEPGVYAITITIMGDFKGELTRSYQYIVVYDPSSSFVTGGGWIWSPPGAYSEDPSLEGKATFGFVSKYKKGVTVPIGQTEFQFNLADLKFHSSSYDWLVVSGKKATFKGIGSINGGGEYKFMISAIDGNLYKEALPDRFRIKIWFEENGTEIVVYDNQLGADITAEPTTVLGGGAIVIH